MSLQTIVNTGSDPDNAKQWSQKSNANFTYLEGLIGESAVANLSQLLDDIGATEKEVVKVTEKAQIVNQVLDPTKKVYLILQDLELLETDTIDLSQGHIIKGLGADITKIICTEDNATIFYSQNATNINVQDITLTASGVDSNVFDVLDSTGFHEFRLVGVNFINCTSIGQIKGYRQWYLPDLGIYSCNDGFLVSGAMSGIYYTQSNITNFSGTLFKQGSDLTISNRMFVQANLSFNLGAKFIDFLPSVFLENESLQIDGCIVSLDGVKDDGNAELLLPNINANDPKSLWGINNGLPSTAVEKIVIDENVSGTYNIDWLNDAYDLVLTDDTVFTESNLPATGRRTKTLNITVSGSGVPTFPTDWYVGAVGSFKSGDLNSIDIKFRSAGKYAMKISNSLSVYPAPILGSVTPISVLPDTTTEIIIQGSFYTPQGFVLIDGQVVNTIEFDPDTANYILSVTSGLTDGEYDITISNGTAVTFEGRFIVNLGVVYIPLSEEWINKTGSINTDLGSEVKIDTFSSLSTAKWNRSIDYIGDFKVVFKFTESPLGTPYNGSENVRHISLYNTTDNLEMFGIGLRFRSGLAVQLKGYSDVSSNTVISSYLGATDEETASLVLDKEVEFRFISGVMYFYFDGVLKETKPDIVTSNLNLGISIKTFNIKNIKYIELP